MPTEQVQIRLIAGSDETVDEAVKDFLDILNSMGIKFEMDDPIGDKRVIHISTSMQEEN